MDIGTGLAIGITAGAAIIGSVPIALRLLVPRKPTECEPLQMGVCHSRFDGLTDRINTIDSNVAWIRGRLHHVLKANGLESKE